jgi:hypothetical protein
MRTMHRMLAVLVPLALVAAACGSGAATATPSPDLVPAASTTPVGTPKDITPSATPVPSVEPMAPAKVTGAATLIQTDEGTESGTGDRLHISGMVVKSTEESSDPRVDGGKSTARVTVDTVGDYGWETVEMVIEKDGGTWEGTCSGAIRGSGNASSLSCWLTGTGAYSGLTYYFHGLSMGTTSRNEGVILPLPAPEAP